MLARGDSACDYTPAMQARMHPGEPASGLGVLVVMFSGRQALSEA